MIILVVLFLSLIFAPSLSGQKTEDGTFILSLNSDDLSRDYAGYYTENRSDLDVTGITVLRAMREKSTLSQRNIISILKSYKDKGEILSYKPLWLIDAIIVTTSDSIINILSKNNNFSEIYQDVNLFNRGLEPLPVDTSLFHILQEQIRIMKIHSERSEYKNGEGRRISVIGGSLPAYFPYSPDNINVIQIYDTFNGENEITNWDWLTVSSIGWRDTWDNRAVANKTSIKYVPLFRHRAGTPLSKVLLALHDLMNVSENNQKPDIIILAWDVVFDNDLILLWDTIRSIESSQTAVLLMYPENSAAIIRDLPGLFVQGYSNNSKAPDGVVKAPQLLQLSDGTVYFSDLVSLGYTAATLALLRNDNDKALLYKRYNALKYISDNSNYSDFNIKVANSALNMGTTKVQGTVTLAGTRSPAAQIRLEISTDSEHKIVDTDENGKYSVIVISEDAMIKIDEVKYYSDSLSVNLRGRDSYIADFSLVQKERVNVSGNIRSKSGNPIRGSVKYFMEGELFTTASSNDIGNYSVELVPGNFDLIVFPEFPYAVEKLNHRVTSNSIRLQPISVSIADVGIISLEDNDDHFTYYASALDSLEISYSYHQWDIDKDKKYLFDLLGYKTVIIYSGNATPFASVTSLMNELNDFLMDGSNVIFTGQKILEFMEEYEPFKSDGLKFAGNRNELLLYNSNNSGLPIYTTISGVIGADNQTDPDAISYSDKSIPFIFYGQNENIAAAVSVKNENGGSYALFGFGLESVHKPHESSSFAGGAQLFDYTFKMLWNSDDQNTKIIRYEFPNSETISGIKLIKSTPEPFTTESTIRFYISQPANVKLELYDIEGTFVGTILNDSRDMGGYEVRWLPKESNIDLSPGLYILLLQVQEVTGLKQSAMSKMLHM